MFTNGLSYMAKSKNCTFIAKTTNRRCKLPAVDGCNLCKIHLNIKKEISTPANSLVIPSSSVAPSSSVLHSALSAISTVSEIENDDDNFVLQPPTDGQMMHDKIQELEATIKLLSEMNLKLNKQVKEYENDGTKPKKNKQKITEKKIVRKAKSMYYNEMKDKDFIMKEVSVQLEKIGIKDKMSPPWQLVKYATDYYFTQLSGSEKQMYFDMAKHVLTI